MKNLILAVLTIGLMRLEGQGTVYPCADESSNPNLTCIKVGTDIWKLKERFDRPMGVVSLKFTMQKLSQYKYKVIGLRVGAIKRQPK